MSQLSGIVDGLKASPIKGNGPGPFAAPPVSTPAASEQAWQKQFRELDGILQAAGAPDDDAAQVDAVAQAICCLIDEVKGMRTSLDKAMQTMTAAIQKQADPVSFAQPFTVETRAISSAGGGAIQELCDYNPRRFLSIITITGAMGQFVAFRVPSGGEVVIANGTAAAGPFTYTVKDQYALPNWAIYVREDNAAVVSFMGLLTA